MKASSFSNFAPGCALLLLLVARTAGAAGGPIELVSRVDPAATSQTADDAWGYGPNVFNLPATSRDGRYVAFLSTADQPGPRPGRPERGGGTGRTGGLRRLPL